MENQNHPAGALWVVQSVGQVRFTSTVASAWLGRQRSLNTLLPRLGAEHRQSTRPLQRGHQRQAGPPARRASASLRPPPVLPPGRCVAGGGPISARWSHLENCQEAADITNSVSRVVLPRS